MRSTHLGKEQKLEYTGFVRADCGCAGKGYLSKGYWNSEGELEVGKKFHTQLIILFYFIYFFNNPYLTW